MIKYIIFRLHHTYAKFMHIYVIHMLHTHRHAYIIQYCMNLTHSLNPPTHSHTGAEMGEEPKGLKSIECLYCCRGNCTARQRTHGKCTIRPLTATAARQHTETARHDNVRQLHETTMYDTGTHDTGTHDNCTTRQRTAQQHTTTVHTTTTRDVNTRHDNTRHDNA